MPSLGEAYGGRQWADRDPYRLVTGAALFLVGVAGVVLAILLVTSSLAAVVGDGSLTASKRQAGTLAGLSVPVMLLGLVVVLPSSRRERVGALAGALVAGAGAGLFWYAYPARWTRTANPLAFETTMVYFLGSALALWFVFRSLATFTARNNPGGTVTLSVKRRGGTETVQLSREKYERYRDTIRGDGGTDETVITDLLDDER
jgi:hypothetical protein